MKKKVVVFAILAVAFCGCKFCLGEMAVKDVSAVLDAKGGAE